MINKIKILLIRHQKLASLLLIYSQEKCLPHMYQETPIRMFVAVLPVITKNWKQSKCRSTVEWVSQLWYTRTREQHSGGAQRTTALRTSTDEPQEPEAECSKDQAAEKHRALHSSPRSSTAHLFRDTNTRGQTLQKSNEMMNTNFCK